MIRSLIFLLLLALPTTSPGQERTFGNGTLPEFLSLYDVDGSGGLSNEELQALRLDRNKRRARLQARWDSNQDGKISTIEREAAKNAIKATIEARRSLRFDEVDEDKDGFLTKEEFKRIAAVEAANNLRPGVGDRLFSNLDGNADAQVSKDEFLRKLQLIPGGIDQTPLPKPHETGATPVQKPQPDPTRPNN